MTTCITSLLTNNNSQSV